MPNRFCAICGEEVNKDSPHIGMCLKCYLAEHPLFELPSKLSLNICVDCGSYSKKEGWTEPSNNDFFSILGEAVQKFLLKPLFKNDQIEYSYSFNEDSIIYSSRDLIKSVEVVVNGRLDNSTDLFHQQKVQLNLNQMICRNCSNIRSGTYFLSILQLRVENESQFDLINEVLNEVNAHVENLFEKDHRQYISQIEDEKYGVNLYLSTNELMNKLVKFLKTKYHFLLKRTKKLVGRDRQKGKNQYRLKTLVKFLPVVPFDVILINNQEYVIENITKTKVIMRDINNNKFIKNFSYFFSEKIIKKDKGD
ncbi:MAG: NMD3-related protein [Promethearchaeota archaeon]|jgi:NMD protein affecting ribosome stability and mRNA decay